MYCKPGAQMLGTHAAVAEVQVDGRVVDGYAVVQRGAQALLLEDGARALCAAQLHITIEKEALALKVVRRQQRGLDVAPCGGDPQTNNANAVACSWRAPCAANQESPGISARGLRRT
jgi:hypothetical protein